MLLRDKGLAPNTIRRHHGLLSSALRMAVRQDVLIRCPTERVQPPRVIPRVAKYYSPENLKRLYAEVEGSWLELVVKLAGCLGLRREEICGLKWTSVDFDLRRGASTSGRHALPPGPASCKRRPKTAPPPGPST